MKFFSYLTIYAFLLCKLYLFFEVLRSELKKVKKKNVSNCNFVSPRVNIKHYNFWSYLFTISGASLKNHHFHKDENSSPNSKMHNWIRTRRKFFSCCKIHNFSCETFLKIQKSLITLQPCVHCKVKLSKIVMLASKLHTLLRK